MKPQEIFLSHLSLIVRSLEGARRLPRQGRETPRERSFIASLAPANERLRSSAIILAAIMPMGGAIAQAPTAQTVRLTETTIPLSDTRSPLGAVWKDQFPALRELQDQSIKIGEQTGIKPGALGAHFWIATFTHGADKITFSILNGPGCQFSNGPSTPLSSCPARLITIRNGEVVHVQNIVDFSFVAEVTQTDFTAVTFNPSRHLLITHVTTDGVAQREPLSTITLQ